VTIRTNENSYLPGERGIKFTTDNELSLKKKAFVKTSSPTILESITVSLSKSSLLNETDSNTVVS
jgi:hypothetical protein